MTTWLAIVGITLAVFVLRASFILFADPHRFPHRFRQALKYVPPAVLAAIVIPGLLIWQDRFDMSLANPRWIAGALAIAVAVYSRNALATIASGMGALWLLQWAIG